MSLVIETALGYALVSGLVTLGLLRLFRRTDQRVTAALRAESRSTAIVAREDEDVSVTRRAA
jgi:hypothetical protein